MTRLIPRLILCCLLLVLLTPAQAPAQVFGQNKINYETFNWQVYHSPHFDLHYYEGMEPFLEEVVSYAESAYLKLSRELDHELKFRVPLITYKTHGEFQQTNITMSELPEGVAAFAEPVQHRMVLPIDLPPDKLYELISHELTHIFQYSMFFEGYLSRTIRANPPLWLMEGMASYFADDEDNLDRMPIRDAVVNNILPPVQALNQLSFLTYRYGHAIFDYIEQEHGKEGIQTFLFEYRKVLLSNNLQKAFKEAFGYDLDTFNRRFNRYLRKKYFPVLLEKKSPDEYGTEIGVSKPGAVTFSPTISPSGELVAALATPKMEVDLVVLSAEDGSLVKNLTKGWTNNYRYLVSEAFAGRRDLSWSPGQDHVAVFARRENKWPLLIFSGINGKLKHEVVFDDIVQCSSPAFSPDGRRIAFEGNRDGVVDLFEFDFDTKQVRNLTEDEFYDANPWYSDDGTTLLYNRRIDEYWKIFSVDLKDSSKKTQLTFGPSSDIQPSLSRDGKTIYFSSDRDPYGVFNIYALDLTTGDMEQFTDVVGGTFAPVEMAEREGQRHLVFAAFFEGSFRLYRMPLTEPEKTIAVEERLAEPAEVVPFEPPLQLRVDEQHKERYKIKWDLEAPYLTAGVANDGTFLTQIAIQFSDLMGNHRIQVLGSSVADFASYAGRYLNFRRRFNWGADAFDSRDFFLSTNDRQQTSRTTGATAFIAYPFSRYYRFEGTLGLIDNAQDLLVPDETSPTGIGYRNFSDQFGLVNVSFVGDTTRYQFFGPFQGKRFNIGAYWAPNITGDTGLDALEYRLDYRSYRQITRRSVLAFRLASIYNAGERQNSYGFGGLNQLRGYEFRSFVGSRLAWGNLEFRFPLVDQMRFPVLNLGQIRGVLFLDAGAAWYDGGLWWDPNFAGEGRGAIRVDQSGTPVGFKFWDSDKGTLRDGRASYGAGFQFNFVGNLQFNWMWAKRLTYQQYDVVNNTFFEVKSPGLELDFYIAYDW